MRTVARQYAVALVAVAIALALRQALAPWLGLRVPFITLFGAVIVASWYGGAAPAVVAAVLGWVGAELLFIEPLGTLAWRGTVQVAEVGAYFASSLLIAALGGATRRAVASERRLRAFVENSPAAVFLKDEAGRYLFANRAAEKALGTTQWEGLTDADLLPAAAARDVVAHDRAVLERGRPESYDLTVARPGGEQRFHSTKFAIFGAEGERYVGAISVDVTEQWRNERAMREAQTLLQVVADAMPAVVILCSRDMRYLWINREGAAWLRKRPEDLVGVRMAEVMGEAALDEIKPYAERALRGEEVNYERLIEYPATGPRWVNVRFAPAPVPDGAWVAVIADVHDRKLAEQALREADRRKDEFLATLGHELRNPLAPIRNAVALLARKGSPDPEVAWSRDVIERQVDQMSRLIDDLLDIARISSGKLALRRERLPLRAALDMAVETSRPNLDAAGVSLHMAPPPQDHVVDADATRLAQVFANVLNNAAKYTERGGSVRVDSFAEDGAYGVRVSDTGIGFSPELAEKLFEPFAQVEPASARAGGLGMGLALARGIVALHGGSITARSGGLGQGSEFLIRLPRAAARPPASPPALAGRAVPTRPLRVLVADDNRDAADSLARILTLYGHETRVAYDGASAVDDALSFKPQAAVLDIGMPGVNGYDVARRLREALGASVTLIALTGWGQAADRERAAEAGFDHHLTKPTDPGAVSDLLARVAAG